MFSKFSVKRPLTIVVAVILIIVLGIISFTKMQTDLFPNMDLPYVAVVTTYPGASPEKVELGVTRPLEKTLSTTGGIESITSVSNENYSMIILQFSQGTNMDSAMIELDGKIGLVEGQLDDSVGSSELMKINPDMLPLFIASLDVDGMDIIEASRMADEEIIPALERIDGVASVDATGLIEKQIQITLNQHKIDALNDTILRSVDEHLADAKEKLAEARNELESQKAALNGGNGSQLEELNQAAIQLADGKTQLMIGLNALTTAQTLLETIQPAIIDFKGNLDDSVIEILPSLEEGVDGGRQGLNALRTALKEANEQLLELKSNRSQLKAALAQLEAAGRPEDAAQIAALKLQIEMLDNSISSLEEMISVGTNLKSMLTPVLKLLIEAESAAQVIVNSEEIYTDDNVLLEAYTALEDAIVKWDQALEELPIQKQELENTLDDLTAKQLELENGKLTISTKLAEAATALTLAEKELSDREAELETATETAYQKADLSGQITQTMLAGILTAENFSMPAGYITENDVDYSVKVGDTFGSIQELSELTLFETDTEGVGIITLSDVADIEYADNSGEMYAKINGNDGILLSFQKQSNASTAQVSERIRQTIDSLMEEYPGLHITALSDQGIYIDIVINSVLSNLLMGGGLAVIILFLFLRRLKPTFIVAVSIPVSVLFAIAMMYFSGVTLNVVSLAGLALGIGMLVDNSIVVIENIYRLHEQGIPAAQAAVKGASQVAGAIVASTLTTICVFLPIVFTDGLTRQLFVDIGLTIAYSLVASLLIALTLVPSLASVIPGAAVSQEGRWFTSFTNLYGKVLSFTLSHKAITLTLVIALLGVSIFGATQMGTAFMPTTDESQVGVTLEMPKDTSDTDIRAMSNQVAEIIQEIDDVETVGALQGGGIMGMSGGGNSVSMYVLLTDNRSHTSSEVASMILQKTRDLPCKITASGGTQSMMSVAGTGIQIEIRGDSLDELRRIAGDVAEIVSGIEGTENVSDGTGETAMETRIMVDKNKAMSYGLTVAQVYQEIASALQIQRSVTTLTEEGEDYPVIVAKDPSAQLTKESLSRYRLTGIKDGEETEITLGDIAEIQDVQGFSSISRYDQTRTISVTADIDAEHNIGLVSRELSKQLKQYDLAEGYTVQITGENENINDVLGQLIYMVLLAIVLIYLIMVAQFQSLLSPFIVMFTIPLAFTGGLLLLWVCGFEISVVAMLGFLVLAGVVVNNGIVFVDYTNQIWKEGMSKREALIETGKTRIRPILMTALTTILGLLTLAFGMGEGSDILQPMAVVTIGGLTYATLLTLFVVPIMYDIFRRKPMREVKLEENSHDKNI